MSCTNPVTPLTVTSFEVGALSCCTEDVTPTVPPVADVPASFVADMTLPVFVLPPAVPWIDSPSFIAYPITLYGGSGGGSVISNTIPPPAQQVDQPTPYNTPADGLLLNND